MYNPDDYAIEISKFNGLTDFLSSKKIDDNKACSKGYNPSSEAFYTQYLYLKPEEKCTLEFKINPRSAMAPNSNDITVASDNDLITVTNTVSNDKIQVIIQSHLKICPEKLPAINIKDKNKSKAIYSLQVIPCLKQEYTIDFVAVNGKGPDGKTISNSTINYESLKQWLKKIYEPINIYFKFSAQKKDEYKFTSGTAFWKEGDGESNDFKKLRNKYKSNNYTVFWVPLPIDPEDNGRVTVGYAQAINSNYPYQNFEPYMTLSTEVTDDITLAHEIGHGIFGLEHPFHAFPESCRQGEDQYNVMDYDQTDMTKVFLRAHDVYNINYNK